MADIPRSLLAMAERAQGEHTQKTRPKKGKPVEIPVPKREDFDQLVKKAAGSHGTLPRRAADDRKPD